MKGNTPIPELVHGEDVWLMVVITTVRQRRTQQGKLFCEAQARNATGSLTLKIWSEALEAWKEIKPGLWGITGHLEAFQDRSHSCSTNTAPSRSINIASIRAPIRFCRVPTRWTLRRSRFQTFASAWGAAGTHHAPRQYETRAAATLSRRHRGGGRALLSARLIECGVGPSAVHRGSCWSDTGLEFEGVQLGENEYVFGIDHDGNEQDEKRALAEFLS